MATAQVQRKGRRKGRQQIHPAEAFFARNSHLVGIVQEKERRGEVYPPERRHLMGLFKSEMSCQLDDWTAYWNKHMG